MDRPGVCQVPEGSREQGKMEETGCEIICGAPTVEFVISSEQSKTLFEKQSNLSFLQEQSKTLLEKYSNLSVLKIWPETFL